jgi:hypothetical protein
LNNYRRLPPTLILVAACAISALYVFIARVRHANGNIDQLSLVELEQKIAASDATPPIWLAYGQRLFEAGQFERAALAYQRVIDAEPFNRAARLQRALALAAGKDADGLAAFLRDQLYSDPKLAAEILSRPELHEYLSDARFATLQKDAAAQAMD